MAVTVAVGAAFESVVEAAVFVGFGFAGWSFVGLAAAVLVAFAGAVPLAAGTGVSAAGAELSAASASLPPESNQLSSAPKLYPGGPCAMNGMAWV